jgi:hypothetical protein
MLFVVYLLLFGFSLSHGEAADGLLMKMRSEVLSRVSPVTNQGEGRAVCMNKARVNERISGQDKG